MRSESSDKPCDGSCVSAEELISIYYPHCSELGTFRRVCAGDVPQVYRRLLNHTNHMTVTVEKYHDDEVDVEVLRSDFIANHYRREILLRTHQNQRVIQYGIVRLNLNSLADSLRAEIFAQKKPLGRVLIEHNVMREIELFDLFKVTCGVVLASLFSVPVGSVTYGRTALLYCDQEPAIELLEIVTL